MKFTFERLLGAFEFLLLCKKVVLLASSLFRAISFPGEIPYFPFPERLFITSIGTQETIYGDFKARQGLNASVTNPTAAFLLHWIFENVRSSLGE